MPATRSDILFSVVVPAYNYGKGLLKLVDHFLKSGRTDFEIILVDDGSKDDTQEIFSKFSHEQVRYHRKENGERGAARNFGSDLSRGRYIGFFDQDDYPFPDFFSEAANCVDEFNSPDVFCLGMEVRNGDGITIRKAAHLPDPLNEKLLLGNLFACGGIFVKNEIMKQVRFEEERGLVGTEDWLFKLQLAARYTIRYWPRTCWAYIDTGENSVYRFTEADLNSRAALLEKYLKADPVFMARYGNRISEIAAFRSVYTALHLALSGGTFRPAQYLFRALKKNYRGALRPATLGAVKHILKNMVSGGPHK